jgi:hypothetical protein
MKIINSDRNEEYAVDRTLVLRSVPVLKAKGQGADPPPPPHSSAQRSQVRNYLNE